MKHSLSELQDAVDLYSVHGDKKKVAQLIGLNESTVRRRLEAAKAYGITPSKNATQVNPIDVHQLQQRIKRLENDLRDAEKTKLNHSIIKDKIIQLTHGVASTETPAWMSRALTSHDLPGVPTVFVSDLHWAEVVDEKQINKVNRYNLEIANDRLQRLAERTVRLLGILSPKFEYPGIVAPLGGDMISGNIHDELTATNEVNSMPAVLDLFSALGRFIETLHARFGKVFLPCVTGNHGRDCYDFETEILTERGWLRINQIDREKDRVAAYIPEGDTIKFEKSNGWFYDENYDGEMIQIESKGVSLCVTPEHTLWVKPPTAKHNLKSGQKLYEYPFQERHANACKWSDTWTAQCAISGWVGSIDKISIPSSERKPGFDIIPNEDWAEFFGWYVSEGTSESTNARITISQSKRKNPHKYADIVSLVRRLGFTPHCSDMMIRFGSSPLAHFLPLQFGGKQKERRIPIWIKGWPKELLLKFFNAAMRGDGHWDKRNGAKSGRYTSTSDQLLGDMQEIAFKLGLSTNLGERYKSPFGNSGYNGTARKLGVIKTLYRSLSDSKTIMYRGPIWCPRVSSGLVIVRRRGKVTISGNTRKIWGKDRHHTSFDWLLYCFLAKHFEHNKDISFYIPDGPDAYYRIYEHRYLLTHGDQFKGGDGMIGALGPILRGDHKKRSRNSQINMEYDTLIMGHWHQDIFLRRLVVNGSLKGYDEYAHSNNFSFEPPSQQLWLTHPKYRITYRMPVLVDKMSEPAKTNWVSVGG